ncbi:MAG: serine acetyltransferase [Candidatus Korobacteraceae bacterium]
MRAEQPDERVSSSPKNPIAAEVLLFLCRHRVPVLTRLVQVMLGCDINCTIPSGLLLAHPYGITVHSQTRLGQRVTIMQHVTLGARRLDNLAPVIGDDVYIGAGAVVLGAVCIGNRARIGANSVVTKNVPDDATVVGANRIVTSVSDVLE